MRGRLVEYSAHAVRSRCRLKSPKTGSDFLLEQCQTTAIAAIVGPATEPAAQTIWIGSSPELPQHGTPGGGRSHWSNAQLRFILEHPPVDDAVAPWVFRVTVEKPVPVLARG